MNQARYVVYIEHILECIDRIKDYTQNGQDSFLSESLVETGGRAIAPRVKPLTF